jgi:hypothetical protein
MFFFTKHNADADAHMHACTLTSMSTSERLSQQILRIHEVITASHCRWVTSMFDLAKIWFFWKIEYSSWLALIQRNVQISLQIGVHQ